MLRTDPLANPPLLVGLTIAHVILTLIMHRFGWLVPIHILLILGWGVWAVIRRRDADFLCALVYIAGAEVAWRILDPYHRLPYELGKYAVIALCGGWLIWRRERLSLLSILYFALLLPSIWLTVQHFTPLEEARQQIVFNLAGPLALACAVLVCAHLRLPRDDLWRIFRVFILSMTIVTTLLIRQRITAAPIWEYLTARQLSYVDSFASNQISNILSLGLLLIWMIALFSKPGRWQLAVLALIAVTFIATIIFSFSRGGVVIALAAMLGTAAPLLFSGQHARRILLLFGVIFAVMVAAFVVVTVITDGKLLERYTNYGVSGRDQWAIDDLEMFAQHPLFGVGPGVGREFRTMRGSRQWPAHTEFTRLLGEHGIFGVLSLGLLIWMGWRHYRMADAGFQQSIVLGLLIWTALYMSHSATRIVAPSLVFGMTAILVLPRNEP